MLYISSRYCCYVVWVVVDIPVNLSVVFRVLLELNDIFVDVVGGYVFIILFDVFRALLGAAAAGLPVIRGGVSFDGAGVLVNAVGWLVETFAAVFNSSH